MLINPTFRPFSTGNVSRTKKEATRTVSLIYIFYSISEERYRTLLHCLRQVKDIAIDSFTGLVCSQSSFHMLMRKFKHYIIWNIYLQRSCVCLAVLLRASHRSNSYFHYSSRFQQATVSTTCSSFVLLSSVQFTFMTPVFDGIACVNCVIYFKSRNVFNEWLRKLIVLCCCCQGWELEDD